MVTFAYMMMDDDEGIIYNTFQLEKLQKGQYGSVNNIIEKNPESDYDQNKIDHSDYKEGKYSMNDDE